MFKKILGNVSTHSGYCLRRFRGRFSQIKGEQHLNKVTESIDFIEKQFESFKKQLEEKEKNCCSRKQCHRFVENC